MTLSLAVNKTLLNAFTAPACNVSVLHVFIYLFLFYFYFTSFYMSVRNGRQGGFKFRTLIGRFK